jgi:putative colanic acid biosynthesis UDP-glucose lipid carrier transferase
MNSNSQTNSLMMYLIIGVDFMLINILLLLLTDYHPWFDTWSPSKVRTLILLNNLALLISEYFNPPVIHRRVISVGDILNRILRLVLVQSFLAFFFMKSLSLSFVGGQFQSIFCLLYFISILILRSLERVVIKKYRKVGGNSRSVLFIGADSEQLNVYHRLQDDASMGYRIMGYYADEEMTDVPEDVELKRLGTLQEFLKEMDGKEEQFVCDEMYVCLSRRDKDTVRRLSHFCDQHVIRFYFVPVSVETLGINLKRELLDDMEVYTTYEIPLAVPLNKLIKRTFDIVLSLVFLIPTAILFPFVYVIIKLQSPGPIFFKQARTGLDGRDFNMLKFRSMHVNKDADRLQATKDDPRKYPFGNFMRKSNIDELPQFLNVLKGDMSIVGPRPHMLAHTEQYSQLIDKYMVRHFVKPGLTGWAQVTGFRGETKELWQMEGRVKRDIWYIEHWSIWLDIRIIWMTAKTIFIHDKNAY